MKPDRSTTGRLDAVERAHLRDPLDRSHVVHRYEAPADLAALVRRFWIPVWSVPPGEVAEQRVLQYPVALIVVSHDYARFYGVNSGLSTVSLVGEGYAVGVMFQPSAGLLLTGDPMHEWTDRWCDLSDVLGANATELVDEVRSAMSEDPASEAAHARAMEAYSGLLAHHLPVDAEGVLINTIVAFVEGRSDVTKVSQVCEEFDLTERALQRLTRRRLGLTPKWLIQRRRLHEASERLREGQGTLADVAAELGYADQSHFTHDFQAVTGMTPGEFADRFAP